MAAGTGTGAVLRDTGRRVAGPDGSAVRDVAILAGDAVVLAAVGSGLLLFRPAAQGEGLAEAGVDRDGLYGGAVCRAAGDRRRDDQGTPDAANGHPASGGSGHLLLYDPLH